MTHRALHRAAIALSVLVVNPSQAICQTFSAQPLPAELGTFNIGFNDMGQVLGLAPDPAETNGVYSLWDPSTGIHPIAPRQSNDPTLTRYVYGLNNAGQVFGGVPTKVELTGMACAPTGECIDYTFSRNVEYGFIRVFDQ